MINHHPATLGRYHSWLKFLQYLDYSISVELLNSVSVSRIKKADFLIWDAFFVPRGF
jgi:hypothetical protein